MTTDDHYKSLIRACLEGPAVTTRNSLCHRTICYPIRFTSTPLVCARKTSWRSALREWEWFMSGSNSIGDLHESVRPWWQPWANSAGCVASNYSEQFRTFIGWDGQVDQIALMIDGITGHPYSRRNVLTTWNTCDMVSPVTKLTNCHNTVTQAFVEPDDNSLHLVTYQRSADVICGVPHNLIQMWAFLMWLAHRGGRKAGSLTWIGGDCHVYSAHEELAQKVIAADLTGIERPELVYAPTSDDFRADDFTMSGPYTPAILERAEMIV